MTSLALICLGFAVEQEAVWPSDVHHFQWSLEQVEAIRAFAGEQKLWCDSMGYVAVACAIECRLEIWLRLSWAKQYAALLDDPERLDKETLRESLQGELWQLRELIGRDNYFRGIMPECRISQR